MPQSLADILFSEPDDRDANCAGLTWPVFLGAPFGDGVFEAVDDAAVRIGGASVPTQTRVTQLWRTGAQTVQWLGMDFLATFDGSAELPAAAVWVDDEPPEPSPAIVVTEDSGEITVDTGAIAFTVSKTAFNLLESFTPAGESSLVSGSSLYWTDTDGNLYEAQYGTIDAVEAETEGTLKTVVKATGRYAVNGGSDVLRYVVRIHAWAGLDAVKIEHTLIWDQHLILKAALNFSSDPLLWTTRFGNVAVGHGWSTGDAVTLYVSQTNGNAGGSLPTISGGSLVASPLDGTSQTLYYVNVQSATTLWLYDSEANAIAGGATGRIVLTSNGSGRVSLLRPKPELAEFGLRFDLASAATDASVGVADGTDTFDDVTSSDVDAVQDTYSAATIRAGSVQRLTGWLSAVDGSGDGLCVAVRDLAHQTPKELSTDSASVYVKLWSDAGATGSMSLREPHRAYPASGYSKEWLTFTDCESNPFGVSKTHDVWLWPSAGDAVNAARNNLVQDPIYCWLDPEYVETTDAIPWVRAKDTSEATAAVIEAGLDQLFQYFTRRDLDVENQFWNFGDVRAFRAFTTGRTWDCNGYGWGEAAWLLAYRSGERRYFKEGERFTRHMTDVDVGQLTAVGGGGSYRKRAGWVSVYSVLHWAWAGAPEGFWSHPEHMMYAHWMTGSERFADVLDLSAANNNSVPTVSAYAPYTGVTREQYGGVSPQLTYWWWTGTASYLTAAQRWLEIARNAANADHEFKNGDGDKIFPNNWFEGVSSDGWVAARAWLGVTDDTAVFLRQVSDMDESPADAYAADDFRVPAWVNPGTVPNCRQRRAEQGATALVYAFRETGTRAYLEQAITRLAREMANVQGAASVGGVDETYFSVGQGRLLPSYIHGAVLALGAWRDDEFGSLAAWPGNFVHFGSTVLSPTESDGTYTYRSNLRMRIYKRPGIAVGVKLSFKSANLNSSVEASGDTANFGHLRAVINGPEGESIVALNSVQETIDDGVITINASAAGGHYTIDVQGEMQFFSCAPRSNARFFVVELSDEPRTIPYQFLVGPGRVYCRVEDAGDPIAATRITSVRQERSRPVRLLDGDDALLDQWKYDDSTSDSWDVPADDWADVLALDHGRMESQLPALGSSTGVRLSNVSPYFAVERGQWFDPAALATGSFVEADHIAVLSGQSAVVQIGDLERHVR